MLKPFLFAKAPYWQVYERNPWFVARKYCASKGKRLPRISEWEYASDGQNPENEKIILGPKVSNEYKVAGGGFISTTEDLILFGDSHSLSLKNLIHKKAKEKGFIDTIIEAGEPVDAKFDLSVFNNTPEAMRSIKDPSIRDIENLLRDVGGLSVNKAKAVLARGWKAIGDIDEESEAAPFAEEFLNKLRSR